MISITSCPR